MKIVIAMVCGAFTVAPMAHAGVYTDDLTKCLVESTSKDDRLDLVKWIYTAMSKHPAVSSLTRVSDADVSAVSSTTGALLMSLLTERCVGATRSAIKYEGALAIQSSFQVLGQVAMTELLTDPNVGKVMAELDQFVDSAKLASLSEDAP